MRSDRARRRHALHPGRHPSWRHHESPRHSQSHDRGPAPRTHGQQSRRTHRESLWRLCVRRGPPGRNDENPGRQRLRPVRKGNPDRRSHGKNPGSVHFHRALFLPATEAHGDWQNSRPGQGAAADAHAAAHGGPRQRRRPPDGGDGAGLHDCSRGVVAVERASHVGQRWVRSAGVRSVRAVCVEGDVHGVPETGPRLGGADAVRVQALVSGADQYEYRAADENSSRRWLRNFGFLIVLLLFFRGSVVDESFVWPRFRTFFPSRFDAICRFHFHSPLWYWIWRGKKVARGEKILMDEGHSGIIDTAPPPRRMKTKDSFINFRFKLCQGVHCGCGIQVLFQKFVHTCLRAKVCHPLEVRIIQYGPNLGAQAKWSLLFKVNTTIQYVNRRIEKRRWLPDWHDVKEPINQSMSWKTLTLDFNLDWPRSILTEFITTSIRCGPYVGTTVETVQCLTYQTEWNVGTCKRDKIYSVWRGGGVCGRKNLFTLSPSYKQSPKNREKSPCPTVLQLRWVISTWWDENMTLLSSTKSAPMYLVTCWKYKQTKNAKIRKGSFFSQRVLW